MSRTEVFFDSNIILYLLSADLRKAERSEEMLLAGGVVSVQVLNETVRVARGKYRLDWAIVDNLLGSVIESCAVQSISLATHEMALRLAKRHFFAIFDANIVAAALLAGCTTLYSEDMQDGLAVDGLTIRNPF